MDSNKFVGYQNSTIVILRKTVDPSLDSGTILVENLLTEQNLFETKLA